MYHINLQVTKFQKILLDQALSKLKAQYVDEAEDAGDDLALMRTCEELTEQVAGIEQQMLEARQREVEPMPIVNCKSDKYDLPAIAQQVIKAVEKRYFDSLTDPLPIFCEDFRYAVNMAGAQWQITGRAVSNGDETHVYIDDCVKAVSF